LVPPFDSLSRKPGKKQEARRSRSALIAISWLPAVFLASSLKTDAKDAKDAKREGGHRPVAVTPLLAKT